jgi:hypothetical protein
MYRVRASTAQGVGHDVWVVVLPQEGRPLGGCVRPDEEIIGDIHAERYLWEPPVPQEELG